MESRSKDYWVNQIYKTRSFNSELLQYLYLHANVLLLSQFKQTSTHKLYIQ
jgi:hypothetical protein